MSRSPRYGSSQTYYLHDEATALRFKLAGDLSHHGLADLEQARQTAFSVLGRRSLVVDLTGIVSIDSAGAELLDSWHGLGAQFVVTARAPAAQIQSMTRVPLRITEANAAWAGWLRGGTAVWLIAATLMALSAAAILATDQSSAAPPLQRHDGRDNLAAPLTIHQAVKE